jgi:hypothetical protein
MACDGEYILSIAVLASGHRKAGLKTLIRSKLPVGGIGKQAIRRPKLKLICCFPLLTRKSHLWLTQ